MDSGLKENSDEVSIRSMEDDGRFLLIAGKPLMNTREEIDQAFADYKAGKL